MAHEGGWCLRGLALFKWIAIVLCVVIIGLSSNFSHTSGRYYYFYIVPVIFLIITVVTLILYFFEVDRNSSQLPWKTIEFVINIAGCVLLLIGFAIGIWEIIANNYFKNFNEWVVRFLVATILEGFLALTYGYTAMHVNRVGI